MHGLSCVQEKNNEAQKFRFRSSIAGMTAKEEEEEWKKWKKESLFHLAALSL